MSNRPAEQSAREASGSSVGNGPGGTGGGSASPGAIAGWGAGAPPTLPVTGLQEKLGYRFRDEELLKNALVHKSFLHELPDFYLGSNERLEFLGDAVLGLIVSADLFSAHPDMPEGSLTGLRGALVRKSTLAELALRVELGNYLYMSRGEEAAGGRKRPSNLARAVEAVLGAAYIDGGLQAATSVWRRVLGDSDEEHLHEVLRGDFKSRLQQVAQAQFRVTPRYNLVHTSGPEHEKLFTVEVVLGDKSLARGEGRNKQMAEQDAARMALEIVGDFQQANHAGAGDMSDPAAQSLQA